MTQGNIVAAKMSAMKERGKEPRTAGVLDSWIDHAESSFGVASSGRVRWLIASTVITAMLQRVTDSEGSCRFSLKGGTLLQHRLGLTSRATRDIDGIVRGDIDDFLAKLDEEFRTGSWGPLEFDRSVAEEIRVPGKRVNPRRFEVRISLKGKVWRKIQVEISPDEGMAGSSQEDFPPPSLQGFGLPTPDKLVGMAMCYQVAQKIHAATDLHNPELGYRNDRPRDVVDLVLIKKMADETGSPHDADIKAAALDIFRSRAREAKDSGRIERHWPTKIVAYAHWRDDFDFAARSAGLDMEMCAAIDFVNKWIAEIDQYDQRELAE